MSASPSAPPGHGCPAPLWQPDLAAAEARAVERFRRLVSSKHDVGLADYNALWRWSVDNLEVFWREVWEFFGLPALAEGAPVLAGSTMPGARWFKGQQLNYAELLLAPGEPGEVAIVDASESGQRREFTRGQLRDQGPRARREPAPARCRPR